MINELIFFAQISFISFATLCFGALGKEALVAYISLLFVIANIFVIKQITLFSWYATSADAFIIGISFAMNLLQEIWGKEIARKTIWISFTCSAFYMIIAQGILFYIPIAQDLSQPHFAYIFSNTLRIVIASFISYIITQFSDSYVYAYLKEKTNNKYFIARNYVSISLSQLMDTILFSFLGLYGIIINIGHIIMVSYTIKIIAMLLITPWLLFAKNLYKKSKLCN